MKKTLKKIFHVVVDVLVILVLVVSVITLIMALTSKATNGVPSVFGKAVIGVKTDSMNGDKPDSFSANDLLLCDYVGSSQKNNYKEGDVITFYQDVDGNGENELVTHRIYKINEDGSFLTKGDNNSTYDQDPTNAVVFGNVNYYDVQAIYHGTKIPFIGGFINLLQTQIGFFWCILFPMILFFIYQAVRVILNAMAYSKEKGMQQAKLAVENAELTEEQKAKAIAEYLASQNGKPAEEEPAEPSAEQPAEASTEDITDADGETPEE